MTITYCPKISQAWQTTQASIQKNYVARKQSQTSQKKNIKTSMLVPNQKSENTQVNKIMCYKKVTHLVVVIDTIPAKIIIISNQWLIQKMSTDRLRTNHLSIKILLESQIGLGSKGTRPKIHFLCKSLS